MPAPASAAGSAGKGVLFMVASSALITLNDTIIKSLGGIYPVGQMLFVRCLFTLLLVGFFAWRAGGMESLRVHDWRGQGARAVAVVSSAFLFVYGLNYLPLADNVAIAFAGPLFLTALAPALLGERVGWKRWAAVLVGFLGVLIMVRPTGAGLQWAALLPLGAALAGAFRDIYTRRLRLTESSESILLVTTVAVGFGGLVTIPFAWVTPTLPHLGALAVSGILLGCSHFLVILALRQAEAALVVPFKYASFVWAVLLGFVVWGHVPHPWTFAGVALVIGSGLYIFNREILHREPASPVPVRPASSA